MKKFSKKIIFIISFLLIISISSTSYSIANINMESMPKIKATTYFGDEWPMSFWSREYINEEKNFERIKSDGFNTIILCIPWREVQPSFYDDFNHDVIKRIEYIINLADKKT